jgi:hypothetical protein
VTQDKEDKMEEFLEAVVAIEKRYAHEKKGAKTNRRDDVLALVEKFYATQMGKS